MLKGTESFSWTDHDRFNREMRKAIAQSLIDQRQSSQLNTIQSQQNIDEYNRQMKEPIRRSLIESKQTQNRLQLYTIRLSMTITNHIISGGKM
jgi:predicted nucleic acid-binding protein